MANLCREEHLSDSDTSIRTINTGWWLGVINRGSRCWRREGELWDGLETTLNIVNFSDTDLTFSLEGKGMFI